MKFFGRDKVTAAARASFDAEPGERVLGAAQSTGDHRGWVVATDRALVLGRNARIPWVKVVRAGWNSPVMEVVYQEVSAGPTKVIRLHMADPGRVSIVVRDRVTASVVSQQHVPLQEDGKGARMVSRRDPVTGAVTWAVVFDVGLDPADPVLLDKAQAALADLRGTLGL